MSELCYTELVFKEKLAALRKERNISKYEVAKATGLDYGYYHRLENQNRSTVPRFQTMEALADFYGITVSDLFIPSKEFR